MATESSREVTLCSQKTKNRCSWRVPTRGQPCSEEGGAWAARLLLYLKKRLKFYTAARASTEIFVV